MYLYNPRHPLPKVLSASNTNIKLIGVSKNLDPEPHDNNIVLKINRENIFRLKTTK